MCAEYERQIEAEQREVRESMALSPPTRPSTTCESTTVLSRAARPSESTPRPLAPETPQKESSGDGVLSPSSPSATLQVCHSLLLNFGDEFCDHKASTCVQGPRIKTNGSLPREGKRLPSPSRSIGNTTIPPTSPLFSQLSAEPDSGTKFNPLLAPMRHLSKKFKLNLCNQFYVTV